MDQATVDATAGMNTSIDMLEKKYIYLKSNMNRIIADQLKVRLNGAGELVIYSEITGYHEAIPLTKKEKKFLEEKFPGLRG